MKRTLRQTSTMTVLLLSFLAPVSLHAASDSYLDYSGKMDVKTDRVEKTDQEKADTQRKANEETELEKYAPDLFKQQSTDALKAKQKQMENETKQVQDSLFKSDKKDTAIKDIQGGLFANTYTVSTAITAAQNTNQSETAAPISKQVIGALFGLVFGISCCIYAVIWKIWE